MIHLLLLIAVFAHISPRLVADALGHQAVAWEAVMYGIENLSLWVALDHLMRLPAVVSAMGAQVIGAWAVCAYGAFESVQRPACRLLFPMGERLVLNGQTVCSAAGVDTASLSVVGASMAAIVVCSRSKPWTSSQA